MEKKFKVLKSKTNKVASQSFTTYVEVEMLVDGVWRSVAHFNDYAFAYSYVEQRVSCHRVYHSYRIVEYQTLVNIHDVFYR